MPKTNVTNLLVVLLLFLLVILLMMPFIQQRNQYFSDLSLPYYYYYDNVPSTSYVYETQIIEKQPVIYAGGSSSSSSSSSPQYNMNFHFPTTPGITPSGTTPPVTQKTNPHPSKEAFGPGFHQTPIKEKDAIEKEILTELSGRTTYLKPAKSRLPLSQMCVFSSWNTAQSGEFVSTDQIINVLSSGCRLVHFNITNFNQVPMIFAKRFHEAKDGITLEDAIKTCIQYAYRNKIVLYLGKQKSGQTNANNGKVIPLNNHTDPLIITLSFRYYKKNEVDDMRKKPKGYLIPEYKTPFLDVCGTILRKSIQNRKWKGKIHLKTNVNELTNKALVFVDISTLKQMGYYHEYEESILKNQTDLKIGDSSGMMIYKFSDLMEQENKIVQRVNDMEATNMYDTSMIYTMAIPDESMNYNPTVKQFENCTVYHQCQFIPIKFYQKTNLNNLLDFFETQQSAFVPISKIHLNSILPANTEAVMG